MGKGTRGSGSLWRQSLPITLSGLLRGFMNEAVSLTYSKLSRDSTLRTLAPTLPSPGHTATAPSTSLNTIKGLAPKSLTHIHSNPLSPKEKNEIPKLIINLTRKLMLRQDTYCSLIFSKL